MERISRQQAIAAQKENVISEEFLKSLDDEIRKQKEKLNRGKLRISREKS